LDTWAALWYIPAAAIPSPSYAFGTKCTPKILAHLDVTLKTWPTGLAHGFTSNVSVTDRAANWLMPHCWGVAHPQQCGIRPVVPTVCMSGLLAGYVAHPAVSQPLEMSRGTFSHLMPDCLPPLSLQSLLVRSIGGLVTPMACYHATAGKPTGKTLHA